MDATVTVATVGAAASLMTVALAELFKRFKSSHDARAATAVAKKDEATAEQTTMSALTLAFKEIADRQDADIRDLRERMRLVETELLTTRRECELLRDERDTLRADNATLRNTVDLQRGEIANLNSVIEAQARAAQK